MPSPSSSSTTGLMLILTLRTRILTLTPFPHQMKTPCFNLCAFPRIQILLFMSVLMYLYVFNLFYYSIQPISIFDPPQFAGDRPCEVLWMISRLGSPCTDGSLLQHAVVSICPIGIGYGGAVRLVPLLGDHVNAYCMSWLSVVPP